MISKVFICCLLLLFFFIQGCLKTLFKWVVSLFRWGSMSVSFNSDSQLQRLHTSSASAWDFNSFWDPLIVVGVCLLRSGLIEGRDKEIKELNMQTNVRSTESRGCFPPPPRGRAIRVCRVWLLSRGRRARRGCKDCRWISCHWRCCWCWVGGGGGGVSGLKSPRYALI